MVPNLEGIDTIFIDLDGTLLDINEDEFMSIYISEIKKFFPEIETETFLKYFWEGTSEMMKSDDPNIFVLDAYMDSFVKSSRMDREIVMERFISFYQGSFTQIGKIGKSNYASEIIEVAKSHNIKIVLATNPLFPEISTIERCRWAGITFDQFLYVTHAENSTVCKPNPRYYNELLERVGSVAGRTLMVGNHYLYDLSAKGVGIKTWLIDKNLLGDEHRGKYDIDYQGSIKILVESIQNISVK